MDKPTAVEVHKYIGFNSLFTTAAKTVILSRDVIYSEAFIKLQNLCREMTF